ncbi:hypothetical protein [Actinomadura mexicana]|uniref:LPXTG-motif cell wall anchor domain-containing protein n=1 Tax=Actinomadura mexicana TaxID=134959 RepID=A0A238WUL9_9ACTN|nr:hypothetical protein [Actinomadura mexicana]SNR49904.1 hypothetical protein SAMN06265355_103283 [Actinomadura mexicana]
MNHFSRRIVASGTLALALVPAFGMTAAPAFAGVDLDAVAEGIGESGYYVDSHAKYYQSDGAQELLRTAQGRSVAVFIAILPPGNDPGQVLQQLPGLMKRKGTYAVLAGDHLRVSSTALPGARVKSIYDGAVKGSKGKPDLALLRFVQTLPESKYAPPKTGRPGNNGKPAPEASVQKQQEQEERTLAQSQPTGRATGYQAPEDDGSAMPYLLGGGAVVVVAAGAGFLLWRRRSATPAPAGGTGAPAPGAAAAPPPAPGAQPPGAQPPGAQPPGVQPSADGPRPGDARPEPPQNP